MKTRYKLLHLAILLSLFFINPPSFAKADQLAEDDPWGDVIDADGNIQFSNLTDLGEIQVEADWMPDIPFVDLQATYHEYLTPSGNIVLLPSASTLFFMASNPDASGLGQADSALGNGIGAMETMLAGYLTPGTVRSMGYTNSSEFFQDVITGNERIWSFGGQNMLNFLSDMISGSIADSNLYTMLLLYSAGNCEAVPGGCPVEVTNPAPPALPITCRAAFIETGEIQVSGGSSEGGKTAPENPVVIGQDPQRRGVDVQIKVLIPPVVYHYFETVAHTKRVCVSDGTGKGAGCGGHPANSGWSTEVEVWYECVEHIRVFPDLLNSARISINLTESSRTWILTELAQAYPGARLYHPDFSYSFPGPGSVQGDQSVSWMTTIQRIQTADPGDFATNVFVRTNGTPVSAPRQAQIGLGQFTVELVRVTLIGQP